MQVDKTTLEDLAIFHQEPDQSVFTILNHTQTNGGNDYLHYLVANPLSSVEAILQTQEIVRRLMHLLPEWPPEITNGTIMVLLKYYDTPLNKYPTHPDLINAFVYKLLNDPDFSLTRYSVQHFIDFLKGLSKIVALAKKQTSGHRLQVIVNRIEELINWLDAAEIKTLDKEKLSLRKTLWIANFLKNRYKQKVFELIELYSQLDAYLSFAIACQKNKFCFPDFISSDFPVMEATELYHPLLPTPVAYNIDLNKDQNFLFLTGANMAGKSTFIKGMGIGVYLAHLGIGVPAKKFSLSFFNGLISNINVVDNISKGESYFFNEVKRIKNTIEKINDGNHWLVLIDELFKGTNIEDAMKCSTTVIEGVRKLGKTLFILSTHLYEIGDSLKQYSNIQFRYFETTVNNDQLIFNYQLKDGISNDRLGYFILRKEGVVAMLEKL